MVGINREERPDRLYYNIILARDRITIQGSSNVGIM
jgi:hypothetical protein